MRFFAIYLVTVVSALCMVACGGRSQAANGVSDNGSQVSADGSEAVSGVRFDADSAYAFVKRQVDMGPRVPGSAAHALCGEWLVSELVRFGADSVFVQPFEAVAFDGTRLSLSNVMGMYAPERERRVLLVAHYDTRPWADHDVDESLRDVPIDGANDGASGVGVLLEIARQIGARRPDVGVDFLFVDGEDYGDGGDGAGSELSWCLGSQHWVTDMPYESDRVVAGILLDMVGGRGARFHREMLSEYMAPELNAAVWDVARRLGKSRFVNEPGGGVTDDHLFLNRAGVKTIDIIENYHPATGSFNPVWHTSADNMSVIDRETLGDVGAVVTEYIYGLK